jgi:hypothetical protein
MVDSALLTNVISRTGTLPAVSFTDKELREKMNAASKMHTLPDDQRRLQQQAATPSTE